MITTIRQYFFKFVNHDCIACAVRPVIFASNLMIPLRVSCPHIDDRRNENFAQARLSKLIAYIICIITFGMFIWDVKTFSKLNYKRKRFVLNEFLLSFCIGMGAFLNCLYITIKIREMNGLAEIVHKRKLFCMKILLRKDQCKRFVLFSFIALASISFSSYFNFIIICYTHGFEDLIYDLRRFIIELCTYHLLTVSFYILIAIRVYKRILENYYLQVELELRGKLKEGKHIRNQWCYHPFRYKLRHFVRLYLALQWNYREGIKFANPQMTVVWTSVVLLLINNFFNFILEFVENEAFPDFDAVAKLKILCILGSVPYFLYTAESTAYGSDDVLSFLFRFPISKLNADEAAQVELLIMTLSTQKPVLRASNIFTVGTHLLASISGTVVTYLLVALQFHLTWTRQSLESD